MLISMDSKVEECLIPLPTLDIQCILGIRLMIYVCMIDYIRKEPAIQQAKTH